MQQPDLTVYTSHPSYNAKLLYQSPDHPAAIKKLRKLVDFNVYYLALMYIVYSCLM